MREISRSAIVPYTVEVMFDLVADIRAYPDFLPWCTGAEVRSESPDEVVASLALAQAGVTARFTTRNTMQRPSRIDMALLEGPFSELQGSWQFTPLGDRGSRISLAMRFAFANPVKGLVLGAAFEHSCNRLVDAFVERAGEKLGGGND